MIIDMKIQCADINDYKERLPELVDMLNLIKSTIGPEDTVDFKRQIKTQPLLSIKVNLHNIELKDVILSYLYAGWDVNVDGETFDPFNPPGVVYNPPTINNNITITPEVTSPEVNINNQINPIVNAPDVNINITPQVIDNTVHLTIDNTKTEEVKIVNLNITVKEPTVGTNTVREFKTGTKMDSMIKKYLSQQQHSYVTTDYVPSVFKKDYENEGGLILKCEFRYGNKDRYVYFPLDGSGWATKDI